MAIVTPSVLPLLGSPSARSSARLGQGDVAHVGDRRLDDAGEADAEQPPVVARPRLLCAQLVVAGQAQHLVQAALVVARVVHRAGRRAVRHVLRAHEVAAGELRRVEPEAAGGDRHRPLQREVELRAAEAAVEAARGPVGEHDAAAHGEVLHAVGAGQAAVHAVERGRLGGAHVGADVVDEVEPQPEQLAVGGERRLDLGQPLGGARRREQVLDAILGPAHRHPEAPRRDGQQHDVHVDAGLHAERAAGVRRGQQAQPGGPDAERRGRDAVQRERALEVRPRRDRVADGVPVGDDAVALDGGRGRARVAVALAHHEVGAREGGVGVAVAEASARRRRWSRAPRGSAARRRPARRRGRRPRAAARTRPRCARARPRPRSGRARARRRAARRRSGRGRPPRRRTGCRRRAPTGRGATARARRRA